MPDPRRRRPPVILRATITLDGKLCDPPPQLLRGTASEFLDPSAARALLTGGEVGEIHLTICPRIDGQPDSPTLSGPPTPDFFPHSLTCRLVHMETRGNECLLRYKVLRRAPCTVPPI